LLSNLGLLLLRLGVGSMMLGSHGWGKLTSFASKADGFPDPLGLGSPLSLALVVFAEVVCPLLLIAGLATRVAAIPLLVTMLVAAFVIHGDDPFAKKEFALLYALPCLTLVLTGAGAYSVDAVLLKRRLRRSAQPSD